MQDILRNNTEDKQRARAWAFGLGLTAYISIVMMLGGSGGDEVETDMILQMDPVFLLVIQGIASTFMFIGVPLLFIGIALKVPFKEFFPKVSLTTAGLTVLISISFMVVNSAIGEWNMNLDFGNSDFAEWAKRSEEQLKVLTEHLTDFTSTNHFIIALIVVAIIPAIGEELLFRGLIQNMFAKAFANHHVAIWVTGFIFAAIHMQFFGVMPRMLLGVLFGYLYHWSGKLSVAMIGHLVNNGFALIALYLAQKDVVEVSPEQMEQSAPWPAVLIFAGISFFLIRTFYKKFNHA
ncbi:MULTISPECIES: type II CAAX endopeptidase family protein [unclassified Ekhidna]|jgi:membrane protease YdiL (CAAX protease family)|uniref:CPBP family intramembrane glutamic endopeptidase n=1 Tax=unclassified Ekhidna TaxID=2632188 RepID=UPI0032DFC9A2